MKRRNGSFMTALVSIIAILLICGTAFLYVATMRDRNIVKGESLLSAGDYAAALEVFKKADKYSLRPDIRVVKGLAACSLGLEDYEAAAHHYATLIGLEPNNVEAHFTLGQLYIRTKNYGAAEKQIRILRDIGTEEAVKAADGLTSQKQSGLVKGFFRDLFKKIAPDFPGIPGLTEDAPLEPNVDENK